MMYEDMIAAISAGKELTKFTITEETLSDFVGMLEQKDIEIELWKDRARASEAKLFKLGEDYSKKFFEQFSNDSVIRMNPKANATPDPTADIDKVVDEFNAYHEQDTTTT